MFVIQKVFKHISRELRENDLCTPENACSYTCAPRSPAELFNLFVRNRFVSSFASILLLVNHALIFFYRASLFYAWFSQSSSSCEPTTKSTNAVCYQVSSLKQEIHFLTCKTAQCSSFPFNSLTRFRSLGAKINISTLLHLKCHNHCSQQKHSNKHLPGLGRCRFSETLAYFRSRCHHCCPPSKSQCQFPRQPPSAW